jgi:Leucine-rich repeat (LRR) protein
MSDELRRALMAEKKANGECGLAELKQLKRLRSVWMQFQPTEDGDVEKLARELPGLEQLGLARTLVSNVGLQHIEKLSALRDLSLSGTRVTDSGLEHISRLGNLEDLSLGVNSRITDIAITYLAGLPRLTNLSLEKTAITDKGLGTLGGMGLHNLRLDGTAITDGGLEHLTSLKNLRVLNLSGTKVTAVGVAKLQAALPNCKITVDPAIQAELDKLKK